jgi:hypothetical protein
MDEILAGLWQNITGRLTGPMNLRLIVQPAVATILAIRAGIRMHVKIGHLSSGHFFGTPPTDANCCGMGGKTLERFSLSLRF